MFKVSKSFSYKYSLLRYCILQCGLSLSRSSLMSYSMTDLYTENLSQAGYW
jgi:hypothetical protein